MDEHWERRAETISAELEAEREAYWAKVGFPPPRDEAMSDSAQQAIQARLSRALEGADWPVALESLDAWLLASKSPRDRAAIGLTREATAAEQRSDVLGALIALWRVGDSPLLEGAKDESGETLLVEQALARVLGPRWEARGDTLAAAHAYFLATDEERAERLLDQLEPGHGDLYERLITALVPRLAEEVRRRPHDPVLRTEWAKALLVAEQPGAAVAVCREVLERTPDSVEVRLVLCRGLDALGQTEEATASWEAAVRSCPRSARLLSAGAARELEHGSPRRAAPLLWASLGAPEEEDREETVLILALVLRHLGRPHQLVRALKLGIPGLSLRDDARTAREIAQVYAGQLNDPAAARLWHGRSRSLFWRSLASSKPERVALGAMVLALVLPLLSLLLLGSDGIVVHVIAWGVALGLLVLARALLRVIEEGNHLTSELRRAYDSTSQHITEQLERAAASAPGRAGPQRSLEH